MSSIPEYSEVIVLIGRDKEIIGDRQQARLAKMLISSSLRNLSEIISCIWQLMPATGGKVTFL